METLPGDTTFARAIRKAFTGVLVCGYLERDWDLEDLEDGTRTLLAVDLGSDWTIQSSVYGWPLTQTEPLSLFADPKTPFLQY